MTNDVQLCFIRPGRPVYHIVSPADRQEATRKLEISQKLEREALEKSQAPEFGKLWAWLHENRCKRPILASPLPHLLFFLTDCARMGQRRFAFP